MRWPTPLLLGSAMLGVLLVSPVVIADDDDRTPRTATFTFGAGLNTAAPGNSLNHHILPPVVKVRTTLATSTRPAIPGVVNFIVAGFHQVFVYNPHITLQEIQAFAAPLPPPPTNLFINYKVNLTDLLYAGVNPERIAPGNVFLPAANLDSNGVGIPPFSEVRSGDENRVESVGFTVPGRYLVICNVTPHFKDGMFAYVRVVSDRDDDDDDDDRHHHD